MPFSLLGDVSVGNIDILLLRLLHHKLKAATSLAEIWNTMQDARFQTGNMESKSS